MTLLDQHRLKALGFFLILRAIFHFVQKWFESQLLEIQTYLPLLGLAAITMFICSLRMEWVVMPIVTTSERFVLFRESMKRIGPLRPFFRDGAFLSLLSAVVFFVTAVMNPETGLICFSLALGIVALLKFGHDALITYKILRTEWGPSKASKPKSNLSPRRWPEREDDEEVIVGDRIEDDSKEAP